MKAELFDYVLPTARIARYPTDARDGARLLIVRGPELQHSRIRELPELIPPGALVVVNDTRVRKARLLGRRRPFGGKVELFLLNAAPSVPGRTRWYALGRANKPLHPGTRVDVMDVEIEICAVGSGGVLEVEFGIQDEVEATIERIGHVPIPPYLARGDEPSDVERYQTVYARAPGSVAAPTAGLHLTGELIERIGTQGRRFARLQLDVGLGTFKPVTVSDLDQHPMHAERYTVSEELAIEVRAARARGAKVVAIGTTVVRALESAADPERPGEVSAQQAETKLLIQPGYGFRVVDALLTNFHQPKSTLLALVAAFVGRDQMLSAYAEALARDYRFLSYGDAMWIPERNDEQQDSENDGSSC